MCKDLYQSFQLRRSFFAPCRAILENRRITGQNPRVISGDG